jgi:hypothetical protein
MITDIYKKKLSQNNSQQDGIPKNETNNSNNNHEVKPVKKRKHHNDENLYPVAKKISHSRSHGAEFIKSNERLSNYAFDKKAIKVN